MAKKPGWHKSMGQPGEKSKAKLKILTGTAKLTDLTNSIKNCESPPLPPSLLLQGHQSYSFHARCFQFLSSLPLFSPSWKTHCHRQKTCYLTWKTSLHITVSHYISFSGCFFVILPVKGREMLLFSMGKLWPILREWLSQCKTRNWRQ